MLTNLNSAHTVESDTVSTSGWIAQRVLIAVAAVVFFAPFVIGYAGY